MVKRSQRFSLCVSGFLALLLLHACSGPQSAALDRPDAGEPNPSPPPILSQFPNLPFPAEHELDRERTFIYQSGRGEIMVGGIHLLVPHPPAQVARFYSAEMENRDWRLVRRVDHDNTAMLYERGSAICTISIKPEAETTRVIIEIGPK